MNIWVPCCRCGKRIRTYVRYADELEMASADYMPSAYCEGFSDGPLICCGCGAKLLFIGVPVHERVVSVIVD